MGPTQSGNSINNTAVSACKETSKNKRHIHVAANRPADIDMVSSQYYMQVIESEVEAHEKATVAFTPCWRKETMFIP